jgi:hypothetical protein
VQVFGEQFLGGYSALYQLKNRIMEQHYLGFKAQARNYFGILA